MRVAGLSEYLTLVRIETEKAALLLHTEAPELRVTRERGGPEIQSDPIRLELDNRDFYDSLGLKSTETLAKELILRGRRAVLEGMGRAADEAKLFWQPQNQGEAGRIALMRAQTNIETSLAFIPEAPKMSWTGGDVEIGYVPDKLWIDWTVSRPEGTYLPYRVRYTAVTMEEDHEF